MTITLSNQGEDVSILVTCTKTHKYVIKVNHTGLIFAQNQIAVAIWIRKSVLERLEFHLIVVCAHYFHNFYRLAASPSVPRFESWGYSF